jgi:hypothetical protein
MLRRWLHVWHADLQVSRPRYDGNPPWAADKNPTLIGFYACAGDHCGVAPNRFFHFVASPIVKLFLLQTNLPRFLRFVEHEI